MKLGKLIAAAVVLAALGATLFWSNRRKAVQDAAAIATDPMTEIVSLKQDDISRLEIKKKDQDAVDLNRAGSDPWKITSPKPFNADQETVSSILYDLSPLKADSIVDQKTTDLKVYGLDPPVAAVSATTKDGKTSKLLIGDDTPTGAGAYAMLEGDPRLFEIGNAYKTNFEKSLMDLRDKRMLPLDFDKLGKVEITGPKLNLAFAPDSSNTGKWNLQIPAGMRVDSSDLAEVVDKIRLATMDLSGGDADPKKTAVLFSSGAPVATVKITEASGTSGEMQIRKNKGAFYAKSSAMDGVSKVSNDLGADVNKSTEDFREKWLFNLRDDSPEKVEFHDGPKSYSFARSGEDWLSEGKKMDAVSVENFLGTIRTLTATKFVTTGFANPSISMTVTSQGGKQSEKVQIAKAGTDFIGKREDSLLLYQLEAKSIDDMEKAADGLKPAAPTPPPTK
jgi:Domain of unknown function (DUF4340)